MNLTTGKFTAPRPGIYFFSFTGNADFPASSSSRFNLAVGLYLNRALIGSNWVEDVNSVDKKSTMTLQSTLNLKKGDQVWLEIYYWSSGAYLDDNISEHLTHFTGWMLQEDIVASL